jgi:hypothetical protein
MTLAAADVIAESVRGVPHGMVAPSIFVPTAFTLAAHPPAVELFESAGPRGAAWRRQTATRGAWVGIVDAHCVVALDIGARLLRTRRRIHCCRSAEDVMDDHLDVLSARVYVVMMEV